MSKPPLTYTQAVESLRGCEQQLEVRTNLLRRASERIYTLTSELDTAAILLRTIAAEAERTGSWHVPADLQERLKAWVAERDGGAA